MTPNLIFSPSAISNFLRDDFPTFFDNSKTPAINVVEDKQDFHFKVAAPGWKKEDFKIKVINNILEIYAEKEIEKEEKSENDQYLRHGFDHISFLRSFLLPKGLDTETIEAEQKGEIIDITLHKKA